MLRCFFSSFIHFFFFLFSIKQREKLIKKVLINFAPLVMTLYKNSHLHMPTVDTKDDPFVYLLVTQLKIWM